MRRGPRRCTALGQMFFIPANPFWSLMIIAIDVVALWGLRAYGGRENLDAGLNGRALTGSCRGWHGGARSGMLILVSPSVPGPACRLTPGAGDRRGEGGGPPHGHYRG
jgi:hypothetical protein